MKLLGNRLLVKPVIPDRIGLIYLPETARGQGHYSLWHVLQTGPGRVTPKSVLVPVETKAGDRVITGTSHDQGQVQLEDGTSIINEEAILCVIPK